MSEEKSILEQQGQAIKRVNDFVEQQHQDVYKLFESSHKSFSEISIAQPAEQEAQIHPQTASLIKKVNEDFNKVLAQIDAEVKNINQKINQSL